MTATLLLTLSIAAQSPDPQAVEATVERALPFIQTKGIEWIEERDCVSCHRISFMVWSLEAAAQQGFDVDPEKLAGWREWSVEALLAPREDDGRPVGALNLEAVSQLLVSRESTSDEAANDEQYAQFVSLLTAGQQEDGSWKPGGQLPGQKRPLAETTEVSTMWSMLALSASQAEADEDVRRRAMEFLAAAEDGESTEWYAVRLVLENALGNDAGQAQRTEQLLALQNADGGWGWLVEDESDALATGQALYALAAAGPDSASPAMQRAVTWLVEHQREDGSWEVRGTKEKKRDSVQETAVYWGTCWAVLGLVESRTPANNDAE